MTDAWHPRSRTQPRADAAFRPGVQRSSCSLERRRHPGPRSVPGQGRGDGAGDACAASEMTCGEVRVAPAHLPSDRCVGAAQKMRYLLGSKHSQVGDGGLSVCRPARGLRDAASRCVSFKERDRNPPANTIARRQSPPDTSASAEPTMLSSRARALPPESRYS